jgi:ABC-type Zn2+ transport system substrate-binding protein/surface adhesin
LEEWNRTRDQEHDGEDEHEEQVRNQIDHEPAFNTNTQAWLVPAISRKAAKRW